MQGFFQVLALAVVAVTAILVLKKHVGEFALVLAVLCAAILCTFAVTTLQPVLEMLERLEALSGVNTAILSPVLKTAMIGILTSVSAGVCADSGESGIAKMVELCGTAMALYLSTPLISAVLDLLDTLLGG
ncbi:MAG: stage III sporulation protein AD [Oscillospiraceae bacterium]|nr:stage III sporulation protein AD [Oscillospiraceae bacterium]